MDKIQNYWSKCTPMNFKKEKWGYEQKREFRYKLQDYMHECFKFNEFSGKNVLEIGCGAGIDLMEFARNGAKVTGIDLTHEAVKMTNDLFKDAGLILPAIQSDCKKLPFSDKSFDVVYSYGVLHHMPKINEAIKEIRRILKPNGKLMIMLYNKDSLLNAYSIIYWHGVQEGNLKHSSPNDLASRFSERFEGCPYTKLYTKDSARKLLSPYFKNIKIQTKYNVIDCPDKRKVKFNLEDREDLGWHLIVTARRK